MGLHVNQPIKEVACQCNPPCGARHYRKDGPLKYFLDGQETDESGYEIALAAVQDLPNKMVRTSSNKGNQPRKT